MLSEVGCAANSLYHLNVNAVDEYLPVLGDVGDRDDVSLRQVEGHNSTPGDAPGC